MHAITCSHPNVIETRANIPFVCIWQTRPRSSCLHSSQGDARTVLLITLHHGGDDTCLLYSSYTTYYSADVSACGSVCASLPCQPPYSLIRTHSVVLCLGELSSSGGGGLEVLTEPSVVSLKAVGSARPSSAAYILSSLCKLAVYWMKGWLSHDRALLSSEDFINGRLCLRICVKLDCFLLKLLRRWDVLDVFWHLRGCSFKCIS